MCINLTKPKDYERSFTIESSTKHFKIRVIKPWTCIFIKLEQMTVGITVTGDGIDYSLRTFKFFGFCVGFSGLSFCLYYIVAIVLSSILYRIIENASFVSI